jgi:2-oxo-3-hexenedioate decarboxylase/2-keto-4-pentenoate hydratase
MDRIAAAAAIIADARLANRKLDALPENLRPRDLAEGYRVQDLVHERLTAAGRGRVVGHKIGATTPVMQEYMRIDHPCGGGIFAGAVHLSGVTLPYSRFVKLGIECEVAARLGRDMTPAEAPFDRNSAAKYVDAYMAAIELVDDRYSDWPSLGTPTLAADDFFGAGSVLGPPVLPQQTPDLVTIPGRALRNGAEIAAGRGADVMGHPLEALAWLANHGAARGQSLKAGEFISTGSLVKTIWLDPGDAITIEIQGLGRVEMTVTPD